MSTTWTKEQLKSLARVSNTVKKEESSADFSEDISQLKRKVNRRAIPKVIFSAVLLTPALGFIYFFASNNLSTDNRVKVQAAEPDAKTKELQAELEATNAKNEELEAKLAVIKQEQSHPVTEIEEVEEAPPPQPEVKTAPKPVAKPPPPRQRVVRRTPPSVTSTQPRVRVRQPPPPPPPVVASVYGAGSSNDVTENNVLSKTDVAASRLLSQQDRQFVRMVDSSYGASELTVANNYPAIDPELEAALLQEQSMMVLKTGTTAKANLAVPWVQDFSRGRVDKVISVVLTEPLRAAGRKVFLPAQTTILVRAESLGQPDIIEFVAVEAHLPTDSGGKSSKITLPSGTIRFSAENGQPLVALPLRNKDSRARGIFELLDSAEKVWEVSGRVGSSDNLVEGVLRGQRQVRYELGRRERYRNYSDRSIVFLPEGTKLKLYVNQEVSVPSVSN